LNDIYTIINNNYSTLIELSLQQSATTSDSKNNDKDEKAGYDSSVDDDKESLITPMDKRLTFTRLEKLTLTLASDRLLTMMRCPVLTKVTTPQLSTIFQVMMVNITIPIGEITNQRY
jgi:hypothetical protein